MVVEQSPRLERSTCTCGKGSDQEFVVRGGKKRVITKSTRKLVQAVIVSIGGHFLVQILFFQNSLDV